MVKVITAAIELISIFIATTAIVVPLFMFLEYLLTTK
jgi:hypothetical protein